MTIKAIKSRHTHTHIYIQQTFHIIAMAKSKEKILNRKRFTILNVFDHYFSTELHLPTVTPTTKHWNWMSMDRTKNEETLNIRILVICNNEKDP